MKTSSFKFLLVGVLIALGAAAAFAQITATLTGRVTTEGRALPGVLVTISSPNLQGTRTAVTDANGAYIFPALPPGRYDVRFELSGMQPITKKADLAVNTISTLNAEMRVTVMAEAITVTAAAPAVLEQAQVATSITSKMVEELPIARNVVAMALIAPGVNDNTVSASQFQISGGPGYDNLVMVNGVPISENIRRQVLGLFIEDAIQETTVLTGAISAEFGGFTGGVVNSITKSGGNEFSGSFRTSLTNASWSNERPGEIIAVDTINELYGATLGGRIIRDRLWFFVAGRKNKLSDALQTFRTNIPYASGDDEERLEGKLTGQITPKHNLVGSYLENNRTRTNTRFVAATYDLFSLSNREDPQTLLSAHYNGILTTNFLVEAHYSERTFEIGVGSGGRFRDVIRGTLMRNRADGLARFNAPTFCGVCDIESRDNEGLTIKGNYFLSTSNFGSHNFVVGYEQFSEHRHANNHQSASDYRIDVTNVVRIPGSTVPLMSPSGEIYPITGANTRIRWTPIFNVSNTENDLATDSIFINDRWDLSERWSFNLGVRYDKNDAVDADGNVTSDDEAFSPRLTAIFDPRGDGRHRFTASYNRYVSKIVEGPGTAAESAGGPASIDFNYKGPPINPSGTPTDKLLTSSQALEVMFKWFFDNGGPDNLALLRPGGNRFVPGFDVAFTGTLISPNVDEYVLGYGIQLRPNAFAKVDLIHREWSDFYGFRVDTTTPRLTDFLGIGHDVNFVENTDDITREYDGIQLQAAWRPSRFNFGFNYTYAELTGNDEQESPVSGTVGNDPDAYPEILSYERRLPEGWLAFADQRHRVRAWVGYNVPLPPVIGSVNVSALHSFDSGLAYSAAALIDVLEYPGAPDPEALGYLVFPDSGTYYFSERGAFRTDDIHRTDIDVTYSRNLFRGLEFFAEGEVLNVFENEGVLNVDTTVYTSFSGQSLCPGCEPFNPFTETPVEGVHYKFGPNFGQPTRPGHYQTALTYRFSVGLRF